MKATLLLLFVSVLSYAQTTIIPYGSSWTFTAPTSAVPSNWNLASFSASTWSVGTAQLGYGDGDEATVYPKVVSGATVVTAYFRKSFTITTPTVLTVNMIVDDGSVVYVNGVEVNRNNMPTGSILYSTFSPTFTADNRLETFTIPASALVTGSNLIAVEVHQESFGSSDMSFDLQLTSPPPVSTSGLYINELMASNTTGTVDATGKHEDWIEIYNSGSSSVNLLNYYISDNMLMPMKHKLTGSATDFVIPSNGFLLLWASSDVTRGAKHLNFSLSASGESVKLTAPDGVTKLDSVTYGALTQNVAYGCQSDGVPTYKFFINGTPNASNNSATSYLGIASAPAFSQPAGFYPANFNLAITGDAGAQIYYSLDGTEPDLASVTPVSYNYKNRYPINSGETPFPIQSKTIRSYLYASPILVKDATMNPNNISIMASTWSNLDPAPYMPGSPGNPNVNNKKGMVVKARAYKTGYIPSEIVTNSYFVTPTGVNTYSIPVVSLSTNEKNLFEYNTGTFTPGKYFDDNYSTMTRPWFWGPMLDNPQVSQIKPITVEFFEGNQAARQMETDAEYGITGSISTTMSKRSMSISFKDIYGQADFNYPLFNRFGNTKRDFKQISFRNFSNDKSKIIDMTNQHITRYMKFDNQDNQPAAVFLNGEYWGLYDLKERFNSGYFKQVYGLEDTEVDVLKKQSSGGSGPEYAQEGDTLNFSALKSYINTTNLTIPANWTYVQTQVDIENFIDYIIANVFINNDDCFENNTSMFRKRVSYNPLMPYGHDGRWRWYMYSTEGTHLNHTGTRVDNNLAEVLNPSSTIYGSNATLLFLRKFMVNNDFKKLFINRFADMLNTSFQPSITNQIIQDYLDMLTPYMNEEINRWRITGGSATPNMQGNWDWFNPMSYSDWNTETVNRKTYISNRQASSRTYIDGQFSLSGTRDLTIDVSQTTAGVEHGYVHLNTIDLLSSTHGVVPINVFPWSGKYFRNVPVTLKAIPFPGYKFSHWEVSGVSYATTDTITRYVSTTPPNISNIKAIFVVDNTPTCNNYMMQYWDFNLLPSGALTSINSSSAAVSTGTIELVGTGSGTMVRTSLTDGTSLNALGTTPAVRGLELNNPTATKELVIKSPSTGFKNISISYATTRSLNGAEQQRLYYSTDVAHATWTALSPIYVPNTDYGVYKYGITSSSAENNPNLWFKIVFTGPSTSGADGNNRFDNILVTGSRMNIINAGVCTGGSYVFGTATITTAGVYTRTVTNSAGCDSTIVLNFSVTPVPTASITQAGATFNSNVISSATYQWQNCTTGTPIAGEVYSSFTPSVNGTYGVIITNGGCSSNLSNCITINNVSVNELEGDGYITIYPNPTETSLKVNFSNLDKNKEFSIINVLGEVVIKGMLTTEVTEINVSSLLSGTYFLIIDNKNRTKFAIAK